MTPSTWRPETCAQQLWTAPDGTACILATFTAPPFYAVSLVRDTQVIRQRRVYGLAAAQVLAQGWLAARIARRLFL